MRVLLISHTCQSATAGQPKAHALAGFGDVELCVLTPDRWRQYGATRRAEPPTGAAFRFETQRVRWPWVGPAQTFLHHYPKLKELIQEFQPDVIDLWEEPWSLVSVQATRLRNRMLPNSAIVSETEQNIDKKLPAPFEPFRRYTLKHADHVVGRSRGAVEVVRNKGYGGPASVVPNAVDAELFQPMPRAACRSELGVASEAFVVGYVGRLVEDKGLMDLLEAVARISAGVEVIFVGEGSAKEALSQRAERLGIADRVRFAGGQPTSLLPKWINAMNVLALPSRTTASWKEQFGRVLIESQACGVPVIGTDSGAIPDVVGEAGRVVPERDPTALAVAIQSMAESPEQLERMGQAGRGQVESWYTWQRVAERMRDIYRQAIESRRGAGVKSASVEAVSTGGGA